MVEHLTGQRLERFLGERVLRPLAMRDSSLVWFDELAPRVAQGHTAAGVALPKGKPNSANAAWSLHTTAHDFARFIAVMIGRSESAPSQHRPIVEAMLRPHVPLHGPLAWGLGWGLCQVEAADEQVEGEPMSGETRWGGETLFWQWGDNYGYKAFAAGSRSREIGLVVLTNGNGGLAAAERLVLEVFPTLRAAFDALRDFGQYTS